MTPPKREEVEEAMARYGPGAVSGYQTQLERVLLTEGNCLAKEVMRLREELAYALDMGAQRAIPAESHVKKLEDELSAARKVVEAAKILAEKAECLRDPACDDAYYSEGKCAVCDSSEVIIDATVPKAVDRGEGG